MALADLASHVAASLELDDEPTVRRLVLEFLTGYAGAAPGDRWWFLSDTPSGRAEAVVTAPASFRRRGVFIERRDLERA